MRPRFELLDPALVDRIVDEALQLLRKPGIKVEEPEAIRVLVAGGATADGERVSIPEVMVRRALDTVPRSFELYDRAGNAAVKYGQGMVHFDPGSSGVAVLDPETLDTRPSMAADLARLTRVADALPAYDAVSTAVVAHDVPTEIGDLYRLFVVLCNSSKPIVTGAFTPRGSGVMIELLALDAGGREALAERPRAVFDVCPSPPLTWSEFACRNVMDLGRAGVPAELISMPLAGVAAPVTLVGSIVQHAAETLAGIVLHQLAAPGAPIVWGGAPTIVDMRTGATPMGAIETAMIDAGYAAVGRSLGLPTHGYLGATDSKVIDAQAGLESGMTALVGGLAGIDMISGAGMLDFLLAQSPEKLVIDADVIGMVQRLLRGVAVPTETLATGFFEQSGPEGRFLDLEDTRRLFRSEQFLPSKVIDRTSRRAWADAGGLDAFGRARRRVEELVASPRDIGLDPATAAAMAACITATGAPYGLTGLPGVDAPVAARA
ncbi:MAG TPA: trimethylamine methyltransferase family protein [Candidatus Limnocylindrales bacterium]|nr:trimethylamine methyltransferase family protein [Candidatus Limnocylindrales bacterium]